MQTTTNEKLVINVHGWRGVSHSYSLVNQFQLLAWLKNQLALINHFDAPFLMPHWSTKQNFAGLNQDDLDLINSLGSNFQGTCNYNIFAPLDLEFSSTLLTLSFVVTEFGLSNDYCKPQIIDAYTKRGNLIHTPSHWSKNRLIANGIPDDCIYVIPHSVNTDYFHPLERDAIEFSRSQLGFNDTDVVLLNVGTHHWNKGLDVLLKSFAIAKQSNHQLKLILKDQRSTYLINSESYVAETLKSIGLNDEKILSSIHVVPSHLSLSQLNSLYNIADAYVTPYRAEGFNLPALEAQVCGTPIIATAGGATDDFLCGNQYVPIQGKLIENSLLKEELTVNAYIEPMQDHLIDVLSKLSRKAFHEVTPLNFGWDYVCSQLNDVFRRHS